MTSTSRFLTLLLMITIVTFQHASCASLQAGENEDEVVRASPVLRSASPRYARLGKRSAPVINDDQQPQQQQQQHRLSKRTVPTNFRFAGLGKRTVSLAYKAAGLGKRLDDVSDDWETEDPRLYAGPQNDPLFDDYAETGRPEEMEEKRRVSTAMRYAGLGKRQRSREVDADGYMGIIRRNDRP